MTGEHCLHGFTNREIRARLTSTKFFVRCANDPKKSSAKVGQCFRRPHAHGLFAKIPRTNHGRNVMSVTMYLREHHYPKVYVSVAH